jgi:competence protein ComEC
MKVIQFPLSKIAFGFILGIISTYNWNISTESNSLGLVLSLVLFFIFYFVKKTTTKRTMTFGVTIYFVSFFLGGITLINNTDSFQKKHYLHYNSAFKSPQVITLIIREKLKSTKTNDRYIAVVQTINETQYNGKLILNITKDSSAAHINTGSYLKTKETLYRNREPNNPNQFDYSDYLNKKQLYAQLYTSATSIQFGTQTKKDIWFYTDQLRATIKQNLAKNKFSKKELNIAVALLMGQKQEIASDVMQDYQYAGAIHILSVSGLHVGYLLLFLTFLLKPIPNTKKGATIKLLITLLTLASFAVIAGLSPSVLRSVVMFSFVAVGYQLRRTVNIYHTLIVSALLILLFEPYFLFDVGFQLSYLALFFIVWFQPIIAPLFKPKSKIIAYCWTILSVSFAAQIGTLPLSIYYFHQFPGLFFITNLVVAPLLTFIMIIGIIVLFLASFAVTPTILTKSLEWGIYGLNSTVHFVASFEQFLIKDIPFNSFLLISSYATIVATIIWLKKLNFNKLMIVLCLIITMQSSQLYTKWTIQKEEEWIVLNSKKSSIVVERHGDKVAIFTNNQLKKSDFSTTLIKSYLVANYSQIGPKQKLPNLLYYKKNKIMIIDSSGIYLERSKPDILILTQSPKINLDRLLEKLHPKQVVADNSNYKNAQKRWELSCRKQKIPFHATAEKGFFKLN